MLQMKINGRGDNVVAGTQIESKKDDVFSTFWNDGAGDRPNTVNTLATTVEKASSVLARKSEEIFNAEDVSVEIATIGQNDRYIHVDNGRLQIINRGLKAFNELKFFGKNNTCTFKSYIYGWNIMDLRQKHGLWECKWDGAVTFMNSSSSVPCVRNLRAHISNETDANNFFLTFMSSVEKAKDEKLKVQGFSQHM